MQQKVRELWRKPVARRVAFEPRDQGLESPARSGRHRRLLTRARNAVMRFGLGDQLLDDTEPPVALAIDLPRLSGEPAENADKLDVGGIDHPAAAAVRVEIDRRLEAAHRAVLEIAHLHDAAVLLPFAVAVLPAQPQRAQTGAREPVNAPLCVRAFVPEVDGRAGVLIDARAVRHKRPDHFRRLWVVAFLAIVIEAFHRLFRGRPPKAAAPLLYYTAKPQYGFVISGGLGFAPILPRHSLVCMQLRGALHARRAGGGRPAMFRSV